MSLFGALVKTVINVTLLPVAVAKDVLTLGNVGNPNEDCYTTQAIERIKEEADSE